MSKQTDDRLADFAKWFHYHRGTIDQQNMSKRMEFYETAVDNMCLLITYLVEDIQHLEGRRSLILPSGIKLNGDIRAGHKP